VYWWVDEINTGLRSKNSDGQCLLVIIGARPDGRKERVAIGDGYRESKASWQDLLLDLKARGLQDGPLLAVGDGAMDFWAALEEVFPATRGPCVAGSTRWERTQCAAEVATGLR
jgi:putative transposase